MATGAHKPRIAYILTPITFGGSEKVNLNFLTHVDRERFDIEPILFLRPWEKETLFEAELKLHGFDYFSIPVAKTEKVESFRVVRCLVNLFFLLKENCYDIVHTHGYLADLLGVAASRLLNVHIISTCHGFIREGRKLSFYIALDCLALRFFTRVITVSETIKHELETKKVKAANISVIENVVQTFSAPKSGVETMNTVRQQAGLENELMIGYVGRLSKEKGVNFLVEALVHVLKLYQNVKLVLIGEGPEKGHLNFNVEACGLQGKVYFADFQSNVEEWLSCMYIMVLPSLTEGTPMALLEAMSQGIPCVASAVGGVPKIIESGRDGLLVSPGNPEEIAEAICMLLGDRSLREKMASGAREKVARLGDVVTWTKRIEEQYMEILDIKKSSGRFNQAV